MQMFSTSDNRDPNKPLNNLNNDNYGMINNNNIISSNSRQIPKYGGLSNHYDGIGNNMAITLSPTKLGKVMNLP